MTSPLYSMIKSPLVKLRVAMTPQPLLGIDGSTRMPSERLDLIASLNVAFLSFAGVRNRKLHLNFEGAGHTDGSNMGANCGSPGMQCDNKQSVIEVSFPNLLYIGFIHNEM